MGEDNLHESNSAKEVTTCMVSFVALKTYQSFSARAEKLRQSWSGGDKEKLVAAVRGRWVGRSGVAGEWRLRGLAGRSRAAGRVLSLKANTKVACQSRRRNTWHTRAFAIFTRRVCLLMRQAALALLFICLIAVRARCSRPRFAAAESTEWDAARRRYRSRERERAKSALGAAATTGHLLRRTKFVTP